jgi:hypothetical protein
MEGKSVDFGFGILDLGFGESEKRKAEKDRILDSKGISAHSASQR